MAELQYNDPDSIKSVDDIHFPKLAHHFSVRSELAKLAAMEIITEDEADAVYADWKSSR